MKQLELYIHIPFCVRKCAYCDFLSGESTKKEREAYRKALVREIRGFRKEGKGYGVSSIFLGGGTPSLLPPEEIGKILKAVKETFRVREDAEITMEMNPGTATAEAVKGYQKAGVNRLSIGLQSTEDTELKNLGRIHTYEAFLDTYQAARTAGFGNINVDLMSAIPGQTEESWRKTLERITALRPEHISAYSLIIEEGTAFWEKYGDGRKNGPPLPDEEAERRMYAETNRFLKEQGYERYEISNYARPGYACRHNIGYWERTPYLGFGIGAASYFEEMRFSNLTDRAAYTKLWLADEPDEETKKRKQKAECHRVTNREAEEEFFFLGLRMQKGVSEEQFEKQFGVSVTSLYGEVVEQLCGKGLLLRENGRIRLTDRGIDLSNFVMAQFLLEEQEENG